MLGERILLGPGPSLVPPEVTAAMAAPMVGHMDPDLFPVLEETARLLRQVFQTANELTLAVSGTGTAGMEATLLHMVKPGERLVVCSAGFFADRLIEIGGRIGAEVVRVEAAWGRPIDPADLERALGRLGGGRTTVAAVHVETSTGVLHPIADLARVAHAHDAAILVDAVASLGGADLPTDAWDLDACYSGSQKCLSAPPGMAPVTVHTRTRGRFRPATFYLDLEGLWTYWGAPHGYHHTVPVSLVYAMREALRLVAAEGLPARVERHRRMTRALWAGLEAMGLELLVPEPHRSPTITTVRIPAGADDAKVRTRLLREYSIEIAGGLGPLRGQIWRIGLMGYSCQPKWVLALLGALEAVLTAEGVRLPKGDAARAAAARL
ncbi:MAG: alanine--glyoxylate aminotransferase family protein [Armatimonadota bacterium]|nr:alanine--glyoxylate aminotransferase family protein [Armatimonadota bacterium]MDR7422049.1 alanine--glyoxylate aminotransferase family protein [Armatimonadota bacterium]MDR7455381.1 alanine--glyoxylate aminotransferase family protein [Armatimonadota bacterium]MDR7457942.1 alanine--glyoxylate aminotransferase family protein [Armatimonadota bacterium]MDR7496031.1 alanine--glyoxylate aminotransferase family protein [Armatimonadota bacterium]